MRPWQRFSILGMDFKSKLSAGSMLLLVIAVLIGDSQISVAAELENIGLNH